jgi:hypothetical protein
MARFEPSATELVLRTSEESFCPPFGSPASPWGPRDFAPPPCDGFALSLLSVRADVNDQESVAPVRSGRSITPQNCQDALTSPRLLLICREDDIWSISGTACRPAQQRGAFAPSRSRASNSACEWTPNSRKVADR